MKTRPFIGAVVLLLSSATSGLAAGPENWIPVRWPVLQVWYEPRALDLLEGTPINCLLVPWSAKDEVARYAPQVHKRGLVLVGLIDSDTDLDRALAWAGNSGFDGLAVEREPTDSPRTIWSSRSLPVLSITKGVMPRVRALADSATASPSSEPWIEFNSWRVRIVRAAMPDRRVWISYPMQDASNDDYARAIADAALGGGRWVVTPDHVLLNGLLRCDSRALATWNYISATLRFYEQHPEWRSFVERPTLGVLPNVDAEMIKLIARRRISFRILDAAQGAPQASALLALNRRSCSQNGGLTIFYQEEAADVEALSKDIADFARTHSDVRLFNVSSVLAQTTGSPDGKSLLIQLVNYASTPSERITVHVAISFRRARLFRPDRAPLDLKIERSVSGDKLEVLVPDVAVSAALLLEK